MPYSPEYLELWTSLAFENQDKKRLYSYQTFQGRDRKRQTDELFWRNSNELGLDLSGLGFVIDNTTGEIELVFDDSGDNPAELFRWLTFTDGTNSIDAASGADTFTFEGLNDATVTVDPTNKKVSIDVSATGSTQNLIETLNADSGTFTAADPTDSFDFAGDNGITTRIVGDVLRITGPASHSTFVGDSGTYNTTSANQSFRILGGTDISTTVSSNSVTIDFTGTTGGTSLWDENTGTNSLYPATIGRKVGINTNTPDEQFTVKGVSQIQPADESITNPLSVLKLKNTHHTFTTFTSTGGDPTNVIDPLYGSFRIENSDTSLFFTDKGAIYQNNDDGIPASIPEVIPAFEVYNDFSNSGIGNGLVVVCDNTSTSTNTVLFAYNEDTAAPTDLARNAQEFIGDGTVKFAGYRDGNNPAVAVTAGSPHALAGFATNGTLVKYDLQAGATATSTNGSGEITVTHGCASTPTTVIVTKEFGTGLFGSNNQTLGEQIEVIRGTIGTTTFKVKITDTSGAPVSNKIRQVYFIAIS